MRHGDVSDAKRCHKSPSSDRRHFDLRMLCVRDVNIRGLGVSLGEGFARVHVAAEAQPTRGQGSSNVTGQKPRIALVQQQRTHAFDQ